MEFRQTFSFNAGCERKRVMLFICLDPSYCRTAYISYLCDDGLQISNSFPHNYSRAIVIKQGHRDFIVVTVIHEDGNPSFLPCLFRCKSHHCRHGAIEMALAPAYECGAVNVVKSYRRSVKPKMSWLLRKRIVSFLRISQKVPAQPQILAIEVVTYGILRPLVIGNRRAFHFDSNSSFPVETVKERIVRFALRILVGEKELPRAHGRFRDKNTGVRAVCMVADFHRHRQPKPVEGHARSTPAGCLPKAEPSRQ